MESMAGSEIKFFHLCCGYSSVSLTSVLVMER